MTCEECTKRWELLARAADDYAVAVHEARVRGVRWPAMIRVTAPQAAALEQATELVRHHLAVCPESRK